MDAKAWAKKAYGDDSAIVKVLSASTFSDGGAPIPPEVASEVIELLRPPRRSAA